MFDVSPVLATLIMFGMMFVLLLAGVPIAFALGAVGVTSILLLWGPKALSVVTTSAWAVMDFYTLVAVPLFIFMAMILQNSGVVDALFKSLRIWASSLNGGLALGVIAASTLIAAMSGLTATATLTMGISGLPLMLRAGYSKTLACGAILVGGGLGSLIPPSLIFIIYGVVAEVSIGKLFLGGVFPGLILSFLYSSYIGIRCYFQPKLGPALPLEERGNLREKIASTKGFVLPLFIIMACLAPIFLGVCSPTEAASIGVGGALVSAAICRKLNFAMMRDAAYTTFKVSCMVMWVTIGAFCFKAVFCGVGGPALARDFVSGLSLSPILIVVAMQLSYMVLGCFLDSIPIVMITMPVYIPIIVGLGFDRAWFGVLFIVNMQMAYITPPFGFDLFYMRSIAPPEVTTGDIYRSILPFLPLIMIALTLVLLFPQLALFLPNLIFGLK